jgi:hypothetical protein
MSCPSQRLAVAPQCLQDSSPQTSTEDPLESGPSDNPLSQPALAELVFWLHNGLSSLFFLLLHVLCSLLEHFPLPITHLSATVPSTPPPQL